MLYCQTSWFDQNNFPLWGPCSLRVINGCQNIHTYRHQRQRQGWLKEMRRKKCGGLMMLTLEGLPPVFHSLMILFSTRLCGVGRWMAMRESLLCFIYSSGIVNEGWPCLSLSARPEVKPIPSNGLVTVQTGDSVTLGCEVTRGSPAPEVKWYRKERKMPSGEEFIRGLRLTYTSVTRHHSGNYVCSADNGFGEATTTYLKLDVQRE